MPRARCRGTSAPARARMEAAAPAVLPAGRVPASQTEERPLISTNLGRDVRSPAVPVWWAGTTKAGGEGTAGCPGMGAVPPQSGSGGGGGGGWRGA